MEVVELEMPEEPLYRTRDPRTLSPYFERHMLAMTAEELVQKGDIAVQLAIRDEMIARLERRFKIAEELQAKYELHVNALRAECREARRAEADALSVVLSLEGRVQRLLDLLRARSMLVLTDEQYAEWDEQVRQILKDAEARDALTDKYTGS
jgi:hypothetical protein